MTRRGAALGLLLAVASIVALAVTAPAQQPKRGGVLRVMERFDPIGFDTLGKKKASIYTQYALAYTHNRLFKFGPTGEVVPDLAASVSQPDPTTYVVVLKKGVRWHAKAPVNGRELTSDDVKFTVERALKSPEARLFPTLKAITTPDRSTVRFELSAPYPAFVANLAATTMYIYAREAGKPLADGGRDYTSVETVIGTGPFTLEEYREKQRLVFKRNPGYFESGRPYLDGVEVYVNADPSAQLAALRTGKIDLISPGFEHAQAGEARAIPGATVRRQAIFQTSENLIGRMDAKPWNDIRVRRAVALAIDRDAFSKAVYPEGSEPFSGPIPYTSAYALPLDKLGEAARFYRHDPAAARKLLAEAGYPNGFQTKLTTTPGYGAQFVSRTELLKDMLSQIGVEASIAIQEYPVWIASTYKGSYEGMVHIPTWTLGDEEEWLGSYTPGDTRNQIHLNDPEVTDLVRQAREARNEAARARLIGQFVWTFHANLFRVFVPQPVVLTVVGKGVRGYDPTVRGYSYPTAFASVWLE